MSKSFSEMDRILIVDDDPRVREDYEFPIQAAGKEPVPEAGPLGSLASFLKRPLNGNAAVSDHQLKPAAYAAFDGAELVSAWYQRGFPAILCTTFDKSNTDQFRSYRRWLPVVMPPSELTPETLMNGLDLVQREIRNEFIAPRRPWRAVIHFVDFQRATNTLYAKLPGWSTEAVALRYIDLPAEIRDHASTQTDFRCYASANLGAESNDELYISDWEY